MKSPVQDSMSTSPPWYKAKLHPHSVVWIFPCCKSPAQHWSPWGHPEFCCFVQEKVWQDGIKMSWSLSEARNTKEKFSFPIKLTRNNMFDRVIQVGCQKALSIGNSIVKHFSMPLLIFVLFSLFCRRNKHLGLQLSSQFQMKMLKCWHVCRMDNLILIQLPLIYFSQTPWFVWVFSKLTHECSFSLSVHSWDISHLLYFNLSEGEAELNLPSALRGERGAQESDSSLTPEPHPWFYHLPLAVPQGMIPIVPGEQGLNPAGCNTSNSPGIHKADKVITP